MSIKRTEAPEVSLIDQGCNANCCRHGSPYILPKERESILAVVGSRNDVFIPDGNHFVIGRNKDGSTRNLDREPCPFLTDNSLCELQVRDPDLKPLDCLMHPIFPKMDEAGKVSLRVTNCCSACRSLTPNFRQRARRLIEECEEKHRVGLAAHQERFGFPLEKLE